MDKAWNYNVISFDSNMANFLRICRKENKAKVALSKL